MPALIARETELRRPRGSIFLFRSSIGNIGSRKINIVGAIRSIHLRNSPLDRSVSGRLRLFHRPASGRDTLDWESFFRDAKVSFQIGRTILGKLWTFCEIAISFLKTSSLMPRVGLRAESRETLAFIDSPK
ncbi:uncharacterized protein LOC143208364 [Lasioglossum baleicum]|uniref:uncharacterized protein LOC143208364 n=1 Tax=Lasioglossum baleicum TaxID=434251 RepID=UPI003FCD5A7C